MTERFDFDLRRSFREHGEKSLKGFEFTPAMQQRVLQQIRAEETGVAPTTRPARRLPTSKQMIWVVTAAAAFVIAIRIGSMGVGNVRHPGVASAPSTTAAPMAAPAAPAPAAPKTTAPGPAASAPAPAPASTPEAAGSGEGPRIAAAPLAAVPPTISAAGVAAAGVFELTLPENGAADAAAANAPTFAPRMTMAAAARHYALVSAPGTGEARELSQVGVLARDGAGAELWMQPLAGIDDKSRLAVSPDGRTAVSMGAHVSILNATGVLERTMSLSGGPVDLSWSADGRLAVVLPTGVFVYGNDRLQFSVTDLTNAQVRFGPAGTLAVLGDEGGTRTLGLYDAAGNRTLKTSVENTARALAFSTDGAVIVAGGRAFDQSGRLLWQAPFEPDGALLLGGSTGMLLWNGHSVLAVGAGDGVLHWQAHWSGPAGISAVTVSPDGAYVALAAKTETGGGLWLLHDSGAMALAQAVPALPDPLAFAGDQLLLFVNGELQVRTVQP